MAPLASQLELVLRQLLQEHQRLLQRVEAHEAALRSYDIDAIARATKDQDQSRQTIAQLDIRRRAVLQQLMPRTRNAQQLTLSRLAEQFPDRKMLLLQLRDELKNLVERIQQKTLLIGKIAAGVMGHLNATVRIIASAASGPATYTRSGLTTTPARISSIEAVA
jgi:hypothetical protein